VVGGALNKLVTAVVDDFIMPIAAASTPDPKLWQSAVTPGPIAFKIGDFGSALINFLIVGVVAWRISKAFIRPAPAAEPPATKPCPRCKMIVDATATRCAHCTSDI
jgi:large conductance mechanosensitive channel